jgi:hypothetical protein
MRWCCIRESYIPNNQSYIGKDIGSTLTVAGMCMTGLKVGMEGTKARKKG